MEEEDSSPAQDESPAETGVETPEADTEVAVNPEESENPVGE